MREWPDGWEEVTSPASLEEELHGELAEGHELFGRAVRAIGRRRGYDDFLFALDDTGEVVAVHLTWSRPDRPPWPWSTIYPSFEAFAADHREA